MIYVCWDGGTLVAGSAYVILHEKVQVWIQSEISQNLKQLASGLMQNILGYIYGNCIYAQ